MGQYTRRQLITLVVFCVCQMCNAVCISLQAPFYPAEAESKGAVPSQYGFVFGIYELVVFVMSPIYGKYMNTLGVKMVNNTGIFTVAFTCILFGFLEKMEGVTTFITFSFLIRIVEATGAAAFATAAFSIIAKEFPENVGTAFASLETFFGIGLILGPTVGGALFQVGGFMLPFAVVGGMLLVAAVLVLFLLPTQDESNKESREATGSMLQALREPCVLLNVLTVAGASISIGFLQATLEPHLRPLHLTPLQLGLIFVLNGATYALSAPVWGWLCDKKIGTRAACAIGALLVALAFILVGPAPFLPLHTSLNLCVFALIIHGLGFGAELVASFSGLHKDVIERGFPDNISTYGMVSGLWASSFALGCFVGPSAAGVLFDKIGFPWATITVVVLHLLLFSLTVCYMCTVKPVGPPPTDEERAPLVSSNSIQSENCNIPKTIRPSPSSYGSLATASEMYW